jgi:hypothetical protein
MKAAQQASSAVTADLPVPGRRVPREFLRGKLLVVGLVVTALLVVLGVSLARETMKSGRPDATALQRPSLTPPRPPLTPAEETYAHALWAIHADVKNAAYGLTFSGLNYKLRQTDRAEFGSRVRSASESLGQAESRIRSLVPPPSLGEVHAQYLEAVHLFQQSASEMLKVAADGRDDHLLAAHPLSQEASEKLLRVGNVIWPGEYLPN